MADLIKKIKIKKQDGTFTDYIPIGAEASNVSTEDGLSVENKLKKKPYYFDTVADMKVATFLAVGDYAITLGYYEPNDGGNGEYKIVQSSDSYYETLNNNLKAELIVKDFINIKQCGANTTNDMTNLIQNILNLYKKIEISEGTYETSDTLVVQSNTILKINNASIHNISSTNKKYILQISGKQNVKIEGQNATLYFDKPATAQQACIYIGGGCQNIIIDGVDCKDAGGDGLTLSGGVENISSNITIKNCLIDNNRRQGISLIGGIDNIKILNNTITNTSGSSPQKGIDLESWQETTWNKNIYIEGNYFEGNVGGAICNFENNENIFIRNNHFNRNTCEIKTNNITDRSRQPNNIFIEDNFFERCLVYIYNALGSYYVKNNTFNYIGGDPTVGNNGFSKETSWSTTEVERTEFYPSYVLNNTFIYCGAYVSSSYGDVFQNNNFYDVKGRVFSIIACWNLAIKNNFIHGYNTSGTVTDIISLQNNKKILIDDNVIYANTNTQSPSSLILVKGGNTDCLVRNNNFLHATYSGSYAITTWDSNPWGVCLNNSIDGNITFGGIRPQASETVSGQIATLKELGGKFVPYICYWDTSENTYKWKKIQNDTSSSI